jgi:hypothetical protein
MFLSPRAIAKEKTMLTQDHDALIARLFPSKNDAAIARDFTKECARTGISPSRVEALLNESAVLAQRAAKGEFDPTNARDYLRDFAKAIGTEPAHVEHISGWLGSAPDSAPAPSAAETLAAAASADAADDATIAAAERALREDNGRSYWVPDGATLREGYASAMARREAARQSRLEAAHAPATDPAPQAASSPAPASSAPPAPAPAPVDRRAEIVGMMGDQRSAYWRGPQAEAMQQEFRNLVVPPEAPASAPGPAQ